jgi:hypothetical protein
MNPYAAHVGTQRTVWGTIWKTVVALAIVLPCIAIVAFVYCKNRVDRTDYLSALNEAPHAEDMRQLDNLLLQKFEKEIQGSGRAVFTARPFGSGLCSCAPAVTDVIDVTYDSSGQIVKMSISQSIGIARRKASP